MMKFIISLFANYYNIRFNITKIIQNAKYKKEEKK